MTHKIIMTGANGQVGRELLRQSQAAGFETVALGSKELDITCAEAVDKMIALHKDAAFLVNCAAYTAVDRAEDEPDKVNLVNAAAVGFLVQACRRHNMAIIHLSTDYVFDGNKTYAYTEADRVLPQNIYGRSKYDGELALAAYPQHLILRVSWVFGQFGHNFVKTVMRLANERQALQIVNDQLGCPTAAVHIAEVIVALIEIKQAGNPHWGTYHYCDAPSVSWFEFAEEIVAQGIALGKIPPGVTVEPITSDQFKTRVRRPQNSVLNCAKIGRDFGIQQKNWCDALGQVISNL